MVETRAGKRARRTTFGRIELGAGFDARVEPIFRTYGLLEPTLGFFDRRRERKKVEKVVDAVRAGIVRQKAPATGWEKSAGECVCNLRVARMGLVRELKTWLRNGTGGEAEARWPHLHALRDRPCLLVPVPFASPVSADPGDGEPLPVASSTRLRDELAEVNEEFRIDDTFAIKKMVEFLDASQEQIDLYERKRGADDGFWPKFSYVLLKKIADVSVQQKLPAIFA